MRGLLTYGAVLENPGLNVVGNQEYAQAVPHVRVCPRPSRGFFVDFTSFSKVHYHIIPAPQLDVPRDRAKYRALKPPTEKEMHIMEWEGRTELDEDFARELVDNVRRVLAPAPLSNL